MTLPSSGTLGSDQVLTELGRLTSAGMNSAESDVRALAGIAAGAQMSSLNLYGKSWQYVLSYIRNTTTYFKAVNDPIYAQGSYIVFAAGTQVIWREQTSGTEGAWTFGDLVQSFAITSNGSVIIVWTDTGTGITWVTKYTGIGGSFVSNTALYSASADWKVNAYAGQVVVWEPGGAAYYSSDHGGSYTLYSSGSWGSGGASFNGLVKCTSGHVTWVEGSGLRVAYNLFSLVAYYPACYAMTYHSGYYYRAKISGNNILVQRSSVESDAGYSTIYTIPTAAAPTPVYMQIRGIGNAILVTFRILTGPVGTYMYECRLDRTQTFATSFTNSVYAGAPDLDFSANKIWLHYDGKLYGGAQ